MGNFRIEIEAMGGHGDGRREGDPGYAGDGDPLAPQEYPEHSLDRVAFEAVEALKAKGATIVSAKLVHWPGTEYEIVDDIAASLRTGSFDRP